MHASCMGMHIQTTYINKAIMEMQTKKRGTKATISSNARGQCVAHNSLQSGTTGSIVVC